MRRQITPGTAGARDPENRLKKKPVVAAAAAGVRRLPQTMRLHLRPLGVCQYVSIHPKLESQTSLGWNPEPQQALEQIAANRVHESDSRAAASGRIRGAPGTFTAPLCNPFDSIVPVLLDPQRHSSLSPQVAAVDHDLRRLGPRGATRRHRNGGHEKVCTPAILFQSLSLEDDGDLLAVPLQDAAEPVTRQVRP